MVQQGVSPEKVEGGPLELAREPPMDNTSVSYYIGIMEKKMETIIVYWDYIGPL